MGVNVLLVVVIVSFTSCMIAAGGGGESVLNLLSKIESNSANCSIVLDDIPAFGLDKLV